MVGCGVIARWVERETSPGGRWGGYPAGGAAMKPDVLRLSKAFKMCAAAAAISFAWEAQPRPNIQATVNTTDPFLVENGLKSAVIFINGFADGQSIQGFVGTAANPWNVTTTSGGFFNIDS